MKIQSDKEIETVCGGVIDNPQDYPSADHEEETVYFCTQGCLKAFEKDPARFIAGEIEHPLD
jgi:YHS domain-containing protein